MDSQSQCIVIANGNNSYNNSGYKTLNRLSEFKSIVSYSHDIYVLNTMMLYWVVLPTHKKISIRNGNIGKLYYVICNKENWTFSVMHTSGTAKAIL